MLCAQTAPPPPLACDRAEKSGGEYSRWLTQHGLVVGVDRAGRRLVEVKDPDVQDGALLQGGAQRPVEAVFEVELAAPADDMWKQVAVEGRVRCEYRGQVEDLLRGDQLVQPNGLGRDLRPFAAGPGMVGIRSPLADLLEDHEPSLEDDGWRTAGLCAHPDQVALSRYA
jgi:hypothetical protein